MCISKPAAAHSVGKTTKGSIPIPLHLSTMFHNIRWALNCRTRDISRSPRICETCMHADRDSEDRSSVGLVVPGQLSSGVRSGRAKERASHPRFSFRPIF